jgi:hypothetical protein
MIDHRIGHLLVRSGDIESKIERLESEAMPGLRDDSVPLRSKAPPSKVSKPVTRVSGDIDPTSLVNALMAMQAAVQEIRDEQRRTSQQINEIHLRLKKRRRSDEI